MYRQTACVVSNLGKWEKWVNVDHGRPWTVPYWDYQLGMPLCSGVFDGSIPLWSIAIFRTKNPFQIGHTHKRTALIIHWIIQFCMVQKLVLLVHNWAIFEIIFKLHNLKGTKAEPLMNIVILPAESVKTRPSRQQAPVHIRSFHVNLVHWILL